jgi:hypothetical protein
MLAQDAADELEDVADAAYVPSEGGYAQVSLAFTPILSNPLKSNLASNLICTCSWPAISVFAHACCRCVALESALKPCLGLARQWV